MTEPIPAAIATSRARYPHLAGWDTAALAAIARELEARNSAPGADDMADQHTDYTATTGDTL